MSDYDTLEAYDVARDDRAAHGNEPGTYHRVKFPPNVTEFRGRDRTGQFYRIACRCPDCFLLLTDRARCPTCHTVPALTREYGPPPVRECRRCHGSGRWTHVSTTFGGPATRTRRCPNCDPS
jgi:hypothetical protein